MSEILTLSSRPKSFEQLIGQERVIKAIEKQVASGRMPRVWMFCGETGSGKTTIARIIAASYQCRHSKRFGYPCERCYDHLDQFSVHEVNASDTGGIDELRELIKTASYYPTPPSLKRVIILDEAHKITNAAQNLLLKPLEEPPKSTVWILGTSDPTKLLKALRRRPMTYTFRALRSEDINVLIQKILGREKEELYEEILKSNISSAALVVMACEKFMSGASVREAVHGHETSIDTLRICRAVFKGNFETLHSELKKASSDDYRLIRAAVSGYLNAILMKTDRGSHDLCQAVIYLAEVSRLEESVQVHVTNAVLHKIAAQFARDQR